MPLPDPLASRAVLIGVDTYENLADLPAVANNIERLAALLTADDLWGLPPEHLAVLSNPTSKDDVLDAVHTAATEADDVLLVYFAGHGLLTADVDLRLALPHTDAERLYRGVPYDDVRDLMVHTGRALARVVILDCCYSGSALTGYMGAANGIANPTMAEGTYVMTSSAETKPAMAPPGEKYTAFTGELLHVIEEGVPGGPDPLPMDVLFTEVRDRLAARTGIPAPQQRARNAGHTIALVRNRRQPRSAEDSAPAAEEIPPVRLPVFVRLARLLHPLLVMAAVVSLPFVAALSGLLDGSDDPCRSWTTQYDGMGECVGVSDGSHSFMPELDRVSEGIARANAAVSEDEPFVTIALLAPLTADDDATKERILHQVQGAYAAQRRINDADTAPYVRLVLAHPGMPWSLVADQLADMARSQEHNLRAVVGFDVTYPVIGEVVQDVTNQGVPAVAGSFTPNSRHDHGLSKGGIAWVMPSADDQVSALASVDKDVATERRSVLVWDVDGWGYMQDLRNAFREQLGDTVHHTARYSSNVEDEETMTEQVASIADKMCALPAAVENVLFAGHPADLRHFVHALGNRACQGREFTVVSGSEASALYRDPELDWSALHGAGITVEYTSGAHPDGAKGRGMEELKDLVERLGPTMGAVDLTDGETISAYDSTLTAAQTIREKAGPGKVPSLSAVAAGLLSLRFEAATGRICLDELGRASNKAVTILRLDPDRRAPRLVATAYPRAGGCG
jgi:ABC-type branched-subunit amino acid transport system substrate-binding protein